MNYRRRKGRVNTVLNRMRMAWHIYELDQWIRNTHKIKTRLIRNKL